MWLIFRFALLVLAIGSAGKVDREGLTNQHTLAWWHAFQPPQHSGGLGGEWKFQSDMRTERTAVNHKQGEFVREFLGYFWRKSLRSFCRFEDISQKICQRLQAKSTEKSAAWLSAGQKTFCTPARQLSVICASLTSVHGALACKSCLPRTASASSSTSLCQIHRHAWFRAHGLHERPLHTVNRSRNCGRRNIRKNKCDPRPQQCAKPPVLKIATPSKPCLEHFPTTFLQ